MLTNWWEQCTGYAAAATSAASAASAAGSPYGTVTDAREAWTAPAAPATLGSMKRACTALLMIAVVGSTGAWGSSTAEAAGTRIKLRDSNYGRVLFSGTNRAIYLFDADSPRTTRCHGACAVAWPPVLTKGKPRAGGGVNAGKLGTLRRPDGRRQVTYNGHPLYFYVDDPRGEILCQNVSEFGGLWLVVNGRGNAVR